MLLSLVALSFAGCPRRGPSGGPPTPPPPAGQTVQVTAKEWGFEPAPILAKAGTITFRIKNEGAVEHNFLVENKPGAQVDAIQPGGTKTLPTDLTPGQYTVFCNLPGHREAGMIGTLKVE